MGVSRMKYDFNRRKRMLSLILLPLCYNAYYNINIWCHTKVHLEIIAGNKGHRSFFVLVPKATKPGIS